MLTDNEDLPKKISNDYFAAVGDLKTYLRPVSKIIPFGIFYTEKLKKKPTCRLLAKIKIVRISCEEYSLFIPNHLTLFLTRSTPK